MFVVIERDNLYNLEEYDDLIAIVERLEIVCRDNRRELHNKRGNSLPLDYATPELLNENWTLTELDALPKSAKEAKELGNGCYFDGRLCGCLHVCPRNLHGICVVCAKQKRREFYIKNREQLIKHSVKKNKEKFSTDPKFRAATISRHILQRSLSIAKLEKKAQTQKYLSYTPSELSEHCLKYISEKLFLSTGTWNLDHIIPICLFDLTLPYAIACANSLENLMPLPVKEHRTKTSQDLLLINNVKKEVVDNPAIVFYEQWVKDNADKLVHVVKHYKAS